MFTVLVPYARPICQLPRRVHPSLWWGTSTSIVEPTRNTRGWVDKSRSSSRYPKQTTGRYCFIQLLVSLACSLVLVFLAFFRLRVLSSARSFVCPLFRLRALSSARSFVCALFRLRRSRLRRSFVCTLFRLRRTSYQSFARTLFRLARETCCRKPNWQR